MPGTVDGPRLVAEIERLERALKADPNDVASMLRLADFCVQAARSQEAAALFVRAMALAPARTEIYVAMSELLRREGLHADAVELLQTAIERHPAAAALWHAIGRTMLDLQDVENAGAFFDEALRLEPDQHLCRMERAALHCRTGRLAEALADYERLRAAMPHEACALIGWADVKALMGSREEARLAYTAALGRVRDRRAVQDRIERLAIMGFTRPLSRQELPAATAAALADVTASPLHIVFFHVDMPGEAGGPFDKPDYHAMLARAVAVGRVKAPRARIVLLSDETTSFSAQLPVDRIVRQPIDTAQLMYARLHAQRNFLAAGDWDGNAIFLDVDVIVNRDPAEIFDGSFDVGLTWRLDPAEAPFNGGVILCRKTPGALRFFDHLIATHHALERFPPVRARFPDGIRRWWGDQLAIAATIGWDEFARRRSDRMSIDKTPVRFLPESEYNFAMSASTPLTLPGLKRRFFIHFKGARKDGLQRYADHLLGPATPKSSAVHDSAPPSAAPVDPRYTTYDLGVAPITYDVMYFLALAHNRGVKHIDIVPGGHFGFRDDGWCQKADVAEKQFRLWNIIVPACQLAGMTIAIQRDRAKAAATVYKLRPIVEEGIADDVFHASAHAKRWVDRWLNARGLRRPVVVNLRESQWPSRNSNMAAWRRFAADTNAVVIPDTDGGTAFGHVFDAVNMERRLALYEAASVVVGVNNGPLALCWLSRSIPYLTFKMVAEHPASTPESYLRQGFPIGSQFKWAGPHQRLIWAEDDYATICRAYDAFLAGAPNGRAAE